MAVGDITTSKLTKTVKLLEAATAVNGVPALATDGVAIQDIIPAGNPPEGLIVVASTAGSATMTVTLKLWVYHSAAAVWTPFGTHATDETRGVLNGGSAIGELASPGDTLRHSEKVSIPWAFDRVYVEVTAIGGTATAVSVWFTVPTSIA